MLRAFLERVVMIYRMARYGAADELEHYSDLKAREPH